MNVELDRFHACPIADVFHVQGHTRLAARVDLRRLNKKIAILKFGLAQPLSEGVERRAVHVDVPLVTGPAFVTPTSLWYFVVIVNR